jgi:VWFA-related protein
MITTRRAEVLALLLLALPIFAQVQERITVERIIVDARVTEANGEAITGLKANDFRVLIDGRPATIESVDWIPETALARDLAEIDRPPVEVNRTTAVPPPRGRLLVFLFQTDFARNVGRVTGQMQVSLGDDYLEWLEPDDRVAVFSYDSHLKFRLDFSDDKRRIKDAMQSAILINEPAWPPVVPLPSLGARLDRQELKNAKSFEEALIILGNALRPIPGPKTMVLFGWGMGHFSTYTGVHMDWKYPLARYSLESARVSVFSIDFTQADAHSLEVGLGKVAGDTGGFYAKTFHFPKQAVQRLQRTLVGHYELEVRKPDTNVRGAHSIEVATTRKGAYVLARTSYVDKTE